MGRGERLVATRKRALVVVESPTKVKTIQKYLDSKFIVKASMGHVRDLPKSALGVDPKKGFKPKYVVASGKKKILDDLKKAAERAEILYVATDPDREGEAIGWHLAQELPFEKKNIYRVTFNEITERAVKSAFLQPGKIDLKKVDAQQARRILDRLVGYSLSPLLWEKVQRGLSAGRVQSVAVRLIVDREREIQAFQPVEYWSLHARLEAKRPPAFVAALREYAGEKADLRNEEATRAIIASLDGAAFVVKTVTRGERRRNPAPPFITSTLQQEAGRKLGFSAKKTMMLAQQLYEGIDVGEQGAVGLITYMRTDSVRIAAEAQAQAREWVTGRFGAEYLPASPPVYKSRGSAQEAHEAIRPSDTTREPKHIARSLNKDQLALYRLIWERFLASQMNPAVYDTVSADIEAGRAIFRAQGQTLKFKGFTAVYVESREEEASDDEDAERAMPLLEEGERLTLLGLDPKQHFTQPPPRYSEAALIKALEELGIGRPSTYASILGTIINDRGYVHRERRTLFPTELGIAVTDKLIPYFADIMNVEFTAQMESELDKVEEGELKWADAVEDFYKPFTVDLKRAKQEMKSEKAGEPTGEACPECGEDLLKRRGRFGPFIACSNYPTCKYIKKKEAREIGLLCPECGQGQVVERKGRWGRFFYGCRRYPECRFTAYHKPIPEPCPDCGRPYLLEKETKKEGKVVFCGNEACHYKRAA